MRMLRITFAAGVIMVVLAGCAGKSDPSAADLMRGYAGESQVSADMKKQLAQDWEKGSKLVKSGEKRVKDGERRIKSAERDLNRAKDAVGQGFREISEGTTLMLESERLFHEKYPDQKLVEKK